MACADGIEATLPERLWLLLHQVPAGRVTTYGDLARLAGVPRQARRVGRLLGQLPTDTTLPWHRVLRADGQLTQGDEQARRLQAEGLPVRNQRLPLARYRWLP